MQAVSFGNKPRGRRHGVLEIFERFVCPAATSGNVFKQRDVFVCAAGGRADNDGDAVAAVARNGSVNVGFDLREGVPEQLVIAAGVLGRQVVRQRAQGFADCAERVGFAVYPPAGKNKRVGGIRVEQRVDMGLQAAAERAGYGGAA